MGDGLVFLPGNEEDKKTKLLDEQGDKMIKARRWIWAMMVALVVTGMGEGRAMAEPAAVSGRLVNGIRVLELSARDLTPSFTVYRGDPVKLDTRGLSGPVVVELPQLGIQGSPDPQAAYHFKVRKTGSYTFKINEATGTLTVVEYAHDGYRFVSPAQARELIAREAPVILDVRTPGEYARGHLADSRLIPIRKLQSRIQELAPFKDRPILIYCASGNRSTVGSKILMDQGFSRIYNLKTGIKGWQKKGYPVVK